MSIATVSLTTRLRTWVLVAGLTALLVAIGAVIGGGFLYTFVALAVLMNLLGYRFSDRIALAASRAKPLPEQEAPELRQLVGELASRAGVPVPRLYLIPSEQPNAFATGRNPAHSAVAVTAGLLTQLPCEQVRAVLAHELAHVRNRDVLVSSIAAMIAVNPATASLYIANPLPRAGLAALVSTHPPMAERVRRLRAYDSTTLAAQAA